MLHMVKSIFPPLHRLAGWTYIRNSPKEDCVCVCGHTDGCTTTTHHPQPPATQPPSPQSQPCNTNILSPGQMFNVMNVEGKSLWAHQACQGCCLTMHPDSLTGSGHTEWSILSDWGGTVDRRGLPRDWKCEPPGVPRAAPCVWSAKQQEHVSVE